MWTCYQNGVFYDKHVYGNAFANAAATEKYA